MSGQNMREYIDAIKPKARVELSEGVIDTVRNWVKGLSQPVKQHGMQSMRDLENRLKIKYSAKITDEVKKSNKSWMWSKITYRDLYNYVTAIMQIDETDLNKVLKNPIVNNNLRLLIKAAPPGSKAPILPLTSDNMQNNTGLISTMIDPTTKEYLSKAISTAVVDACSYLLQAKADAAPVRPSSAPVTGADDAASTPTRSPAGAPAAPTPDEIKSAITAIKTGLASMKGTT